MNLKKKVINDRNAGLTNTQIAEKHELRTAEVRALIFSMEEDETLDVQISYIVEFKTDDANDVWQGVELRNKAGAMETYNAGDHETHDWRVRRVVTVSEILEEK